LAGSVVSRLLAGRLEGYVHVMHAGNVSAADDRAGEDGLGAGVIAATDSVAGAQFQAVEDGLVSRAVVIAAVAVAEFSAGDVSLVEVFQLDIQLVSDQAAAQARVRADVLLDGFAEGGGQGAFTGQVGDNADIKAIEALRAGGTLMVAGGEHQPADGGQGRDVEKMVFHSGFPARVVAAKGNGTGDWARGEPASCALAVRAWQQACRRH